MMKRVFCLMALPLYILGCKESATSHSDRQVEQSKADTLRTLQVHQSLDPRNLLTLSDAEKILGEPAHFKDSSYRMSGEDLEYQDSISTIRKKASAYHCGYLANSKERISGKTGVVYFSFEQYSKVSSAKMVYSFYKRANQNNAGFKELHDIGDEAWMGNSPLFVYVRKDDKLFVLKVNKMTSITSSVEFIRISKQIAAAL